MDAEEEQDILEIIRTHRRNLLKLAVQAAQFGMNIPLHLLNEMRYAESQIREWEQQLDLKNLLNRKL